MCPALMSCPRPSQEFSRRREFSRRVLGVAKRLTGFCGRGMREGCAGRCGGAPLLGEGGGGEGGCMRGTGAGGEGRGEDGGEGAGGEGGRGGDGGDGGEGCGAAAVSQVTEYGQSQMELLSLNRRPGGHCFQAEMPPVLHW